MRPRTAPRDPWRRLPVDELGDQLLPRWFVLLALALVPVAIGALLAAFLVFGPEEVPVAERRPPPAPGADLTHEVGDYAVGDLPPVAYEQACAALDGVRVAGTAEDRQQLRRALAGVCNVTLDAQTRDRLRAFAEAGGVVRFAVFEATGVDSVVDLGADPPVVLVNAKFTHSPPLWIAPLVVHDLTLAGADPAAAGSALRARQAEHDVCRRLLAGARVSRGCEDAAELLALPDPLAALRAAGYR